MLQIFHLLMKFYINFDNYCHSKEKSIMFLTNFYDDSDYKQWHDQEKEEDDFKFEVGFWIKKLYEHYHFIVYFVAKYYEQIREHTGDYIDELLVKVERGKQSWGKMLENGDNEDLTTIETHLQKNLEIYRELRNLFDHAKVPCISDLIGHMTEELEYFQNVILTGELNLLEEMNMWSREHAENIDFLHCELPVLTNIRRINLEQIPEIVKMLYETKKVSAGFKDVNSQVLALLIDEDFHHYDERVLTLYYELMALKIKHLKSLEVLLGDISTLPIDEENQYLLRDLLKHEYEEAMFAKYRIQKAARQESISS